MNFYFRPKDHATVCLLLIMVLTYVGIRYCAIAGYWANEQHVIDFDQAKPREYRFELDVNSASWSQLALLRGIGKRLAHRIIEFRQNRGQFESIDQLKKVNGIGPKKLESIRPYLRTFRSTGERMAARNGE